MTGEHPRFDVVVVVPVFDDWAAFAQLVRGLDGLFTDGQAVCVLAVDDGSPHLPPPAELAPDGRGAVRRVEILSLTRNLGHQRAIAVGLAHVHATLAADAVVIMDGDGEDRCADVPRLCQALAEAPEHVVFAERAERSEGRLFRAGYWLYVLAFRLLVGQRIAFGNFCAIPGALLPRVVSIAEIWNHVAAGILRARIAYTTIATRRGTRLAGRTRMSPTALVTHGLSAISVFVDSMAVRLMVASLGLILATGIGIATVVAIRLFTDLAIPGWASVVSLALLVIFLQAFTLSLTLLFLALYHRNQKTFVPRHDYADYVLSAMVAWPPPP